MSKDATSPVTDAVWPQIAKVRHAVLETIATLAPREASYIFTYSGSDEDAADRAAFEDYRKVAKDRGCAFVPVRLLCTEEELVNRIQDPARQGNKLTDAAEAVRNIRNFTPLDPRLPKSLTLDVTNHQPETTASSILRHIQRVAG